MSVQLDLSERQVGEPGYRCVPRPKIIDREHHTIKGQLCRNLAREGRVGNDLVFRELHNQARERRITRKRLTHQLNEASGVQDRSRYIEGQLETGIVPSEGTPICNDAFKDKLGERVVSRIPGGWQKASRGKQPVFRMARSDERFCTAYRQA